jgi:hypothetical protein
MLTGKMGDYTSVPVEVKNGRYAGLAVGGPDSSYLNKTITFHLDDSVLANETDVFLFLSMPELKSPFDLTFPNYPTPTPAPTATPTSTPIATPTPTVPGPMVLSGVIELDEGEVDDLIGKEIVARVGSYFSDPVNIEENYGLLVFDRLVVDPGDYKFLGMEISLLVNGSTAGGNTTVFQSGGGADLALRVSIPVPTVIPVPVPEATVAPVTPAVAEPTIAAPTAQPDPTATNVPVPTATNVPAPTATSTPVPVVDKATAIPPTAAPVVIVVTATPEPTQAPVEAEVEEEVEEGAGGCNAPGAVSPFTGAANALMLFAPLMFVAGYKGIRKRRN